MLLTLLTSCLFLSVGVSAQSTTTGYVEPTVPTGTPVPGNYTGGLRPQIHFSPPQHFMNDPNGMFVDANGTWHLYYQYNPTGIVAGNQHWGHATTQDLYHWENQPIALFPLNESSYIFSGSAVVDRNNTSGFFPNQDNGVVAIFTIATYAPILLQTQGLAISYDGGYSFDMYKGNPVLDIGSSQFRDPQVTWHGDHWIMTVAYAQEFTIGFFSSPDLKNWTHASNFTHHGLLGLQYECPNLVEIPGELANGSTTTMYVLQISINPGAPLGGSISQSFPGTFDGYSFTAVDGAARINDFGKDNYAGQFFNGIASGSDAVSIPWASNWQYAQVVPTGPLENWRSAMGLPRKNILREIPRIGWVLVSEPYDLTPVTGEVLANQSFGNGSLAIDFSQTYSNALYFVVNVTNIPSANMTGSLNFTFISPASGEILQSGFEFGGDTPFWINRGLVRGFDNPYFTDKFSSNNPLGESWILEGVFDRSILEVFLDGGERSATTTFYPQQPLTIMTLSVAGLPPGNISVSAQVYALESAWQSQENEQGTVLGNVTAGGSYKRHARARYEARFEQ